jgi:DNA-binding NarL/FixJ family response regulator
MQSIKTIIVDDHQFLIDGIKHQLSDDPEITIIGQALNGSDAINHPLLDAVDVIIMDLEMPVMNAFTAIPLVLKKNNNCKILILSSYEETSLVTKAIELGAFGYALKNISKQELIKAVKIIAQGNKYLSDDLALSMIKMKSSLSLIDLESTSNKNLTQREKEVLALIANGFSNIEISKKLFLSVKTIDSHRTNLMRKIGAKNVAEVVRYAIQAGIV